MAELAAVGAVCLLALALRWRLRVVTVRGESMAPAYHDGDQLLVVRSRRRVQVGSAIVFVPPAGFADVPWLVKRVVEIAGEPQRGRLIVRGDAVISLDSRQFGPVDRDAVIGVVVRRIS
jgi:signal peptidase I